jgi:hypothetical protein
MVEVVLRFPTRSDAYGFVSESRRLASDLLWEIEVKPTDEGWLVHLPDAVFKASVADALERYHGAVVARGNVSGARGGT